MSKVVEKVDRLEKMMEHLAFLNQETQISLQKLSKEVQEFKEWSKQNIAELRDISRRLQEDTEEFKKEMEEFKEWSKQNIKELRENHEKLAKEMQEFKEWSKQNIAELRENSKRFEEWAKQNIEQIRESDEKFHKEMEEFKEWSKQNIAEIRENSKRFEEWSKQNIAEIRENSRRFEEWAKQNIRDLNKKWGELANRLGTVVEDIIAPGLLEASKKYFGCDEEPDDFMVRRRKKNLKDRSKVREFDLIIVCGDNVIINETKTTPKPEYVEAFHKFIRSGEIFEYFPEFKGKRIIPVFSSLNMPDDIVNLLTKKGIYAATMKGDYIDLVNFERL